VAAAVAALTAGSARAARVDLDPATAPRIVNGVDTHAYPTAGALLYGFNGPATPDNAISWCSGTLIGCSTFLVAAHCVDDLDPTHYLVYLQHAGLVPVASITRHPSYREVTFPAFDAAVIKLGTWVTGVTPTLINQTDPLPFVPATGTIVGFGETRGGANDYGIKRAGTVHTESCPAAVGVSNSDVVCWTFQNPLGAPGTNSDTCFGDSGGPLFLDLGAGPVVAGITSGGTSNNCLPADDSFDANVFTHRAFILGQLDGDSTSACGGLPPIGDAQTTVASNDGTLSASHPSDTYTVNVPAGANALRVVLNGQDSGSFDVNLYVKQGPGASPSSFDCKADGRSVFGGCTVNLPAAGTWSIDLERTLGTGQYQLTTTIFRGPAPTCGNNTREFNEVCDGTDAAQCPGICRPDCTCPLPVCGNGVVEQGEQCDGADDASCPGQCSAACQCPVPCTQGDLIAIVSRLNAVRFKVRGTVIDPAAFNGADPRQRFTLTLAQGGNTVTVDIPANDPGWAMSRPTKGRYLWSGDLNGIRRVKAIDHTVKDGTWKILVAGKAVPGASGIDVKQPVVYTLTVGAACTTTTF